MPCESHRLRVEMIQLTADVVGTLEPVTATRWISIEGDHLAIDK